MRVRLGYCAGIIGLVLFAGLTRAARPNVLFLVVDDLRPAIGAYGDARAVTPNLDRLAARGLLFERAYCQQALCAPSRASVITGRRPAAFPRISGGEGGAHYREELPDVVTLPQLFKQHGYHTESIGKVNHVYPPILDPVSWSVPERLADIVKRDEYLLPGNRIGGFIQPMRKGEATESVEAPDKAYVDGQAADAAIEALTRLRDQPFFLAVGTKRPHLPWSAPTRYWNLHEREKFGLSPEVAQPWAAAALVARPWRYEWRPDSGEMRGYTDIRTRSDIDAEKTRQLRHGYYAAASYVDAQIGRIVDAVTELGLADHTIIVLWADHGYHLGENGQWGKKTNTELDARVPLMIVAPGLTRPGTRTRALVELVDLYPTLAELAGLPRETALEGTSFAPLLDHPDRAWKSAVFGRYVRAGAVGQAIRTERYRYVEWTRSNDGTVIDRELYDVPADPWERRNLADLEPDLTTALARQLHAGWTAARPTSPFSR
ncbi:sulfatase [Synoicihabitans lomoniglobus]|uniref:Sulfatase n=1 Tax=Synoicihabitans lomoniglobus TaxID=2909285 RepID=A0AAF0CMK7_9BACT|nr:sulfatase [Opitutaceae bacterium LMO-M01]WED63411.1 sulfatase [Opitutaceae bacterium LMO-M01]